MSETTTTKAEVKTDAAKPAAKEAETTTTKAEVKTDAAKPAAKEAETTDVVDVKLDRTVMVNGKGYVAGKTYQVPAVIAEDIKRIAEDNARYEAELMRGKREDVTPPAAELSF